MGEKYGRQCKTLFFRFEIRKLYNHCRAVRCGDLVFVSGTTGYNYATGEISDDPAEQTRQTFNNIETALQEVGASFSDLVQIITYFVHHKDWDAIGSVLNERLEGVHPVNSGVQTGLILPEMRVEISATAYCSKKN